MAAMTDYLESGLLNAIFRGNPDSFAFPTGIFIGLTTDSPSDASPDANELSGNGYARVQVVQATGNWAIVSAPGATENLGAIEFPEATSNWLTASGVIVTDSSSGGNVLLKGDLSTPRSVLIGDVLRFKSGDLDITFA